MSAKSILVEAVRDDGITAAHMSRTHTFGTLPSTGDYDQNVLVIAEFCIAVHNFLKDLYDGVPVNDYSLRGGQRSAAVQALILSSLETKDPEV